jgi:hypothetical protein
VTLGGNHVVGAVDGVGKTSVEGGTTLTATHVRQSALTVSGGTMTVRANGGPGGTSDIDTITLASGGKLDLKDNKLVTKTSVGTANGGVYGGVQGMVQQACNGGAWNVPGITTSMPDAVNGLTSLGVARADDVGYAGGTFSGRSVDSSDVLIMYTYAGRRESRRVHQRRRLQRDRLQHPRARRERLGERRLQLGRRDHRATTTARSISTSWRRARHSAPQGSTQADQPVRRSRCPSRPVAVSPCSPVRPPYPVVDADNASPEFNSTDFRSIQSKHVVYSALRRSTSMIRTAERRHQFVVLAAAATSAILLSAARAAAQLTTDIPVGANSIGLEAVTDVGDAAIDLTHAGDGSDRYFIAGQTSAEVKIFKNAALVSTPFIDLNATTGATGAALSMLTSGERGLLGMAFHPNFAAAGQPGFGKFYTYTSETKGNTFAGVDYIHDELDGTDVAPQNLGDHDSVIREWTVNPNNADQVLINTTDTTTRQNSGRVVMRIREPQANHNGGAIKFGPDGMLLHRAGRRRRRQRQQRRRTRRPHRPHHHRNDPPARQWAGRQQLRPRAEQQRAGENPPHRPARTGDDASVHRRRQRQRTISQSPTQSLHRAHRRRRRGLRLRSAQPLPHELRSPLGQPVRRRRRAGRARGDRRRHERRQLRLGLLGGHTHQLRRLPG